LINIAAVSRANMTSLSRAFHGSRVLIFPKITTPISNVTNANGMSDRTSEARRGVSKLKANAAAAISPATLLNARVAVRSKTITIPTAQRKDGSRHATSHDRVIP